MSGFFAERGMASQIRFDTMSITDEYRLADNLT